MDSDVAHPRPCGQYVAGYLGGVERIKLQPQVRRVHGFDNLAGEVKIMQEIPRHGACIDRLDRQALLGRLGNRPAQIAQEGRLGIRSFGDPGHDVQMFRPKRPRIAQRALEVALEPRLQPRHGGKPLRPARVIRRRAVDQRHRHFMCRQGIHDVLRVGVIRKQDLDGIEPGLCCRGDALDERHFGEKPRQIGTELRHREIRYRISPEDCDDR